MSLLPTIQPTIKLPLLSDLRRAASFAPRMDEYGGILFHDRDDAIALAPARHQGECVIRTIILDVCQGAPTRVSEPVCKANQGGARRMSIT